jgi:hypothetical protein
MRGGLFVSMDTRVVSRRRTPFDTPRVVFEQPSQPLVQNPSRFAAVDGRAPLQRVDEMEADRIQTIGAALAPRVERRAGYVCRIALAAATH